MRYLFILTTVLSVFFLHSAAFAQQQPSIVGQAPKFQPYQDSAYQGDYHRNAPSTIQSGHSIGVQRVVPGNAIRDFSNSNTISGRSGVMIHDTGRKHNNQQFIDQSLRRGPSLENRAR